MNAAPPNQPHIYTLYWQYNDGTNDRAYIGSQCPLTRDEIVSEWAAAYGEVINRAVTTPAIIKYQK
jgi:hypothetical protein